MRTEDSPSLDDILGTTEALKRTRLSGKGPAGRLPLTEEMLRDGPSGNIFGMTQAAAMGWDPAKTDREAFMIVTTMGGMRGVGGTPIALGLHTGHWELGLLVKEAALAMQEGGVQPFVWGPARGDLNHWRFETIDLARHLRAGRNVLAAVVWNYGEMAPESQVTWRTGFLLQGDAKAEQAVNTNETWKAARNPAYAPIPFTSALLRGYYVVGPGERVDGARFLWGWETDGYDDSAWAMAVPAVPDGRASGSPRSSQDSPNRWLLVPRTIPLMEERPERMAAVRQAAGVSVPAGFPSSRTPLTIPPGTKARLLGDQAHLAVWPVGLPQEICRL